VRRPAGEIKVEEVKGPKKRGTQQMKEKNGESGRGKGVAAGVKLLLFARRENKKGQRRPWKILWRKGRKIGGTGKKGEVLVGW